MARPPQGQDFLDYLRNGPARRSSAPYARAAPAPLSGAISWDELAHG